MPAKPRPLPDARRLRPERAVDFEPRGDVRLDRVVEDLRARGRDPVARGLVARDLAGRDLLELALVDDFLAPDRLVFVSPFSLRILFTVRAATSSARPPYRPDFLALCLMCLYWRSRFGLAPLGIENPPLSLDGIKTYL
jgi:hypothetical protein